MSTSDVLNNVKSTFSSWDSCMSKAYCKYPVIVAIIIGALIALSLLLCLLRCMGCALECCSCFANCGSCCFGCCGSCCKGSRGRRAKNNDYTQMPPTPYNGYQPTPGPMTYQPPFQAGPTPYQQYNAPQFATFDAPTKNIHEDSLPPMPSWDTASTRRVEDLSDPKPSSQDAMEMGALGPQQNQTSRRGYSQVPNPTSPAKYNQTADYFNGHSQDSSHVYNSDLGAQRMPSNGSHPTLDQRTLSPAPSYHTNAQSDRFIAGATSPSPHESAQQGPRSVQGRYAPSVSTRYEASDYTYQQPQQYTSPVGGQTAPGWNNGYQSQNQERTSSWDAYPSSQQDARPPSLLQVGRKPVNGSIREI